MNTWQYWSCRLPMEWHQLVGLSGSGLYVSSYAALQLGRLDGNGRAFASLNLTAALCVLVSLHYEFNLPSVLIQTSWVALSVLGLGRMLQQSNSAPPARRQTATRTQIRGR